MKKNGNTTRADEAGWLLWGVLVVLLLAVMEADARDTWCGLVVAPEDPCPSYRGVDFGGRCP